jgi:sugar (pentulose or hexulose) kinase
MRDYPTNSFKDIVMLERYIGVVDVGKTNKKVLIYDLNLRCVDSAYKNFDEFEQEGVNYENLDNMALWIQAQLKKFACKYTIKAISVTTHGACAVGIDKDGKLAVPPVAYTTDAGEEFRKDFYDTFGDPVSLKIATGTTEIGSLINVGKLIYFWKKKWPEQFNNIWKILNMPQYFGYLFTGNIGAEPTYVGCHTYLYNIKEKTYSDVAEKLEITDMLPNKISTSWQILGTITPSFQTKTRLPSDCLVTMGIHDSNASLFPYLVKGFKNFVLNSTGTWCVALHPTDKSDFDEEELEAAVFYNIDAFQNPVKTSIFKGGTEFETYRNLLIDISGVSSDPPFDLDLYSTIIKEKKLFILPSVDKGLGIFPFAEPGTVENGLKTDLKTLLSGEQTPKFFKHYQTGFAVLNISLAIQTYHAIKMTGFDGKGTVFIEGGFRRNTPYLKLLGALFPKATISLTKMEEATAFGSAILAKAALERVQPERTAEYIDIQVTNIETPTIPAIQAYVAEFDKLVKPVRKSEFQEMSDANTR